VIYTVHFRYDEKSIFFIDFLNADTEEKLTVGGKWFQTSMSRAAKKLR